MNMLLDYVVTSVAIGMTFLYGCVGEILTEKAGHLNLGIPGIMCIGGASGCLALKAFYGLPSFLVVIFAIIASLLGGALMGAIYCFLTVTLKANQNVTGLAMTTFGTFFNAIYLLPKFADLYGMPMEAIIAMGTTVNPAITNVTTLVVFAVAPLNLIKGAAVSVITVLLYRHLERLLHVK